ncbi:MAG TPA: aminotransferase class III-fold pyridoxal phosphate-dependent enzyme [Chloroflexota bacterium]|jgi:glutamate-1-semialdehyde 2,1-aminomutase|nr:aminotransferase class III-fold pyridoxal phosphate-dependent enzyme [Chloroflexota bacterium]
MAQVRRATIDEERAIRQKKSAALYEEAQQVFPSGVTHDGRYMQPFPIYVTHAKGSRKWDVDGNEYVDYFGGHGALLLGHCHPAVTAAVVEQVQKGSHFGACHELEIRWGQLVQQIVPCARGGQVKFLSSGTEATLMAMRLARAHTGKEVVVKIRGHFHGWHDYATIGMSEPWDTPSSAGIPKAVQGTVRAIPFRDVAALEAALAPGDVAAVIMLQNGATTEYLQQVREITRRQNVLLIFDEVITGFRYAPGGAQEYFGVTPDLCTNAKILAGGYPGGSVAGRTDVMQLLEHRDDPAWQRHKRIAHPGTFNANPVSAAAGVACLQIVKDPSVQKKAIATADRIRSGLNEALKRRGVEGNAGGEVSMLGISFASPKADGRRLMHRFRGAMQLGGVDFSGLGGMVSAVHDQRDVEQTVRAFDQALEQLQAEGVL